MKKRIIIVSLLCTMLLIAIFLYWQSRVIGTISGADLEYITIQDKTYMLDDDNDLSIADKGSFLGVVSNGRDKFRVYSVKGNDQYIYRLWSYDGAFYRLTE